MAFLKRARNRWLLAAVLVFVLFYLAWGEATRTRGAQKVAFDPAEHACASAGPLRYCVSRARGGTSEDILYHLPGRNLDERIWNDDTYYTAMLQSEWQRMGVLPPTVVTVSYGPTWLLAPQGRKPDSGLLEDFLSRLPEIEAQTGQPRRRMLLGESMGGLNVLIAGLSAPERFTKVAALCPGVYAVSPFASFSSMREGLVRTGANPKVAFAIWTMARRYFADDEEWQRASPLALIERVGANAPDLYLSNGLYDRFGNFEGTLRLAERAAARGLPVEWYPLYGGHCGIDIVSLARFLTSEPHQAADPTD
ncbi:MAG: alpha/beta hydrolase-fold protein [Allosphingosinicella sp.]|uniref:alpha/beta hydrolase-fold protein n=1 Tax=Allosphingosinicella sp. TaxID=2823234 RepID=UPI003927C3D0